MQNTNFFEITGKPLVLAQYVVLHCDVKFFILHQVSY